MEEDQGINDIQFRLKVAQSNIMKLQTVIETNEKEVNLKIRESEILLGTKELLEVLKDTKMNTKKGFILETINTALLDIFKENLKIDIENEASENSSGKIQIKYNIVLYQNDIEMARNEKLLGNNGGGVLSVVSILFKMLIGYIYSKNKFYMFDESVSQLSAEYRPNLGKFLHKFCETYDFTLVMVNHNSDMDEFADIVYYLNSKDDKNNIPDLYIERQQGEIPTENYYYSNIKNFQSISNCSFKYKGLTIIRGRSNIGKSASLRAINALLFNTVDIKDHPRKFKSRGSNTYIEFGFVANEEILKEEINPNSINLIIKNNKVVYSFNNMEFAGKNLAFEKVKEKVQQIGFKYIDMGKIYNNFKGNIKEQTERLATTTQHDSFYLVGSKSNELEKIFNFLFDTYKISAAISLVKKDLLDLEKYINEVNFRLSADKVELNREKLREEIYKKKYTILLLSSLKLNNSLYTKYYNEMNLYQNLISKLSYNIQVFEYFELYKNNLILKKNYNIQQLEEKINIISSIIEKSNYYINLENFFNATKQYNYINSFIVSSNSKIQIINSIIQKLDELIPLNLNDYINNIQSLQSNNSSLQIINNKIDIVNKVLNKLEVVKGLDLNNLNDLIYKRTELEKQLSEVNLKEESLNQEFGLCLCDKCLGTGIISI